MNFVFFCKIVRQHILIAKVGIKNRDTSYYNIFTAVQLLFQI